MNQVDQLTLDCKNLIREVATRPGWKKLLIGVSSYLIDQVATHPSAPEKLLTIHSALATFAGYKANRSRLAGRLKA